MYISCVCVCIFIYREGFFFVFEIFFFYLICFIYELDALYISLSACPSVDSLVSKKKLYNELF